MGYASAGRKVFSKECWCSTLGVPNYPLFICHSGEMVQNDVGGYLTVMSREGEGRSPRSLRGTSAGLLC